MTKEEFETLAIGIKTIALEDLIFIVEKDKTPIGVSISLPNINEIIEEYGDVEYIEVDVYLDNDDLFNLFASDFLDTIDYRYNIYSDGDRIEYLIYIKDEEIFIAELKDIGGTTNGFSIWAIFNIK
jgi:hypothetical protein